MGNTVTLVAADGRPASERRMHDAAEVRACGGAVLHAVLIALGQQRWDLYRLNPDAASIAQVADLWRHGNQSTVIGTAFELTVQRAFVRGGGEEYERLTEALRSLGFGAVIKPRAFVLGGEKATREQYLKRAYDALSDDSEVWETGAWPRLKLRSSLGSLVVAHATKGAGGGLPPGYEALWKADVFLGCAARELWVGVSCKASRADVQVAGPGVPFAVAPGRQVHRDPLPFATLKGMPTVGLPHRGIYETLNAVLRACEKWFAVDGRTDKVAADMRPELVTLLQEMEARGQEPALSVADEWLNETDTEVNAKLWTPRSKVALAA